MNHYRVTIGVPVYGVEDKIERCAVSLFEQTYDNIEFVFINDCTKDHSINILNRVITRYPERKGCISIVNHTRNKGLAAARNTGIDHATGDFVMWVDSDDYIEKNMVEELVEKQQRTNADIVSCDAIFHFPDYEGVFTQVDCKDVRDHTIKLLSRKTTASVWGRLIKTSLYKDYQIKVLEGYDMGEDFQVVPKLFYYASQTTILHKPLYHYDNTDSNSYSRNFSERKSRQVLEAFTSLQQFFENKDNDYKEALVLGKQQFVIQELISCCKAASTKDYYYALRKELSSIERNSRKELSIPNRLITYIRNYYACKLYVFAASRIKHLIQKTTGKVASA